MKLLLRLFFVLAVYLFISETAFTRSTNRPQADFIIQNSPGSVCCRVCVLQEAEHADPCAVSTTSTEFRRKLLIESVEEDDDDSFSSKRNGELKPVLGTLIGYGFIQAFCLPAADAFNETETPEPCPDQQTLQASRRQAALRVFRI